MENIYSCGIVPFYLEKGEYKILILKSSRTKAWTFPKGRKEKQEEDDETALREFREETGLDKCYILLDESFFYNYVKTNQNGQNKLKNVILFIGFISSGNIKIPEREICEYKFISVKDLGDYFPQKDSKKMIEWIKKYYENNLN